ncbi:hypothetical protein Mapa_000794 [Marchantia paleacea]|nr:hypothetical protein Mapa_000794 [Marchantia paleacea]
MRTQHSSSWGWGWRDFRTVLAGDKASLLSWNFRFRIIAGAAEALFYLHEGCRQQIIHRDFKTSNIMLDQDFNAMLGDFGLARMVDRSQNMAITSVAETFGYIAPEASVHGKFNEKTDVFAFGAVSLEIVCGRLAYSPHVPDKEKVLVDWVWQKLGEGELLSVVDPRLKGQYDEKKVQTLLHLGLLCSHPNSDDRTTMRQVVEILGGNVAPPPVPSSKPSPHYNQVLNEHPMQALISMPTISKHPEGSESSDGGH